MLLLNIISLDYKLKKQNLGYYNQSIAKSQLDNFRKSLNNFIQNHCCPIKKFLRKGVKKLSLIYSIFV